MRSLKGILKTRRAKYPTDWTLGVAPLFPRQIEYANNIWAISGGNASSTSSIYTAIDNTFSSWNTYASKPLLKRELTYSNGYWVGLGMNGSTGTAYLNYSLDPTGSWNSAAKASGGYIAPKQAANGNGYWVVSAYEAFAPTGTAMYVYTTTDPPTLTWNLSYQQAGKLAAGVVHGNNVWVVLGTLGEVHVTSGNNPTTGWSMYLNKLNYHPHYDTSSNVLAYGNGVYVAAGDDSLNQVAVTDVPTNVWVNKNTGFTYPTSCVVFYNGIFVIGSRYGELAYCENPLTENWTAITSPLSGLGNRIIAIAYGNGYWVAITWDTLAYSHIA